MAAGRLSPTRCLLVAPTASWTRRANLRQRYVNLFRCVRLVAPILNPDSDPDHRQNLITSVWLSGLVVSALGMRTRRPRFESRATIRLGSNIGQVVYTHCLSTPVSCS